MQYGTRPMEELVVDKAKPKTTKRDAIAESYRWNLADIFEDWDAWQSAHSELELKITEYEGLKGTLTQGANALLKALLLEDEIGQLSYRVYFFPSLSHDEDQRDNTVNARRQQAQILMAKASQASAWFNPELLAIPSHTVLEWCNQNKQLAVYRFALEEIYRLQEHVLDDNGERLLSLGTRFRSSPADTYSALTTEDMRYPTITLSTGEELTVTYGQYRALLATNRNQADRQAGFKALYGAYKQHINTYAALYGAIAERDRFVAQARNYDSTLSAALFSNDIPTSVLETLIDTVRSGCEPLQRYHRIRRHQLQLDSYYLFDGSIPLIEFEKKYYYDDVIPTIVESVGVLGADYQKTLRDGFDQRWIDVYENEGKRTGAYSAPVYGVHPYMLLNYNDTLDDVFTLAHELGHSMHTILADRNQPFAYASYTIFVAEVASTLNEALLLSLLLDRSTDPRERVVLLQHAIDSICGTFYTQVLFADWELAAHRAVEAGEPVTADSLCALYSDRVAAYYGDAITVDPLYSITWARIPHFFRTPYYVYQYATCFASSATLLPGIQRGERDAIERYLNLLGAGCSDHPMKLLQRAGADLSQPETVRAVVNQLDELVTQLEEELAAL